uniref:Ovule protein n=1 Tax=Ascaris lumbricoides TaxID=6252 RepID=A0A0M3HZM5_ASCLU
MQLVEFSALIFDNVTFHAPVSRLHLYGATPTMLLSLDLLPVECCLLEEAVLNAAQISLAYQSSTFRFWEQKFVVVL